MLSSKVKVSIRKFLMLSPRCKLENFDFVVVIHHFHQQMRLTNSPAYKYKCLIYNRLSCATPHAKLVRARGSTGDLRMLVAAAVTTGVYVHRQLFTSAGE